MQYQFENNTQEKGLLDDLDNIQNLDPASKDKRIINLLIDTAVTTAIGYALMISIFVPMVLGGGVNAEEAMENNMGLFYAIFIIPTIAYYLVFELVNKGRTLGKMATRTYAVRADGAPLTFQDALLRSVVRMVPFDLLSGLGDAPWHDLWTKTTVVNK